AATKIGREHVDKILVTDSGIALKHPGDQHKKAGRTETALQAVMLHEGALQRIELVAVRQAFDRADLLAVRLDCEHQARTQRLAVDEHRAGAADAVLAADMRARLTAIFADRVSQSAARLDLNGMSLLIDRQSDFTPVTHAYCFLVWRNAARMRRGVAGISSIVTPNGVSASLMALRMAAGAPMAPPSPRPLAWVIVAPFSVCR